MLGTLLLLLGPLVPPHRPAPAPPVAHVSSGTDLVPVVTIVGTRAVVTCPTDAHVELDGALVPFGQRPLGRVAVVDIARKNGSASCVDDHDGARGSARLAPLGVHSVAPRFVADAAGARVVVTVEGASLGPLTAPDDGIYLVWSTGVVHLGACPELHADVQHVTACATPAQVRGRGPARVRAQSGGRLEEAATLVDLGALVKP